MKATELIEKLQNIIDINQKDFDVKINNRDIGKIITYKNNINISLI